MDALPRRPVAWLSTRRTTETEKRKDPATGMKFHSKSGFPAALQRAARAKNRKTGLTAQLKSHKDFNRPPAALGVGV
jgi:hypothetical protein